MNNTYYILRHGNSEANKAGIILSDFTLGTEGYGLTDKGREDIKLSVTALVDSGMLKQPVKIISSPFKRTKESAIIVAELLKVDEITFNDDLRERFFGDFDQKPKDNYKKVWVIDKDNPNHKENSVESVNEVYSRATAIIKDLEVDYKDTTFILVTHGDTAQILECYFRKIKPQDHRTLKTVKQGEYRLLS